MDAKKKPASLYYAEAFLAKAPEDTLSEALNEAILSYDQGKCIPLLHLAQHIVDDLKSGRLCFMLVEPEEKSAERGDDDDELNGPITKKQIGYIAGLTKKVGLDRECLPAAVSPESYYKDLTEGQAIKVIDTLLEMEKALKSE